MKGNLNQLSNEELVLALTKGNRHAFNEIYNRYWKRMFVYAFKIFEDEHVCEDIVQEVFIKLWQNAESKSIGNLEAYLIQAVKYRVSNAIRDLKFNVRHEEALADSVDVAPAYDPFLVRELNDEIERSIAQLPEKCREVFLLSRKENLTNKEIAENLNLSIRTVETHIYNALKLIRQNVQKVACLILLLNIM